MYYKYGYSQPVNSPKSFPRLMKPDLHRLDDSEGPQIIQLLQKYGKRTADYGLETGIAYDNNAIVRRTNKLMQT